MICKIKFHISQVYSNLSLSRYGISRRTVPLLLNGGSFSKSSAPPVFLEDENHFQKSARVVPILPQFTMEPHEPIFEKYSHLRREKGRVLMLSPGLYGGLYGQNLPSPIQI